MTVRTCKEVLGCNKPTVSDRGRYANVCATHKHLVTARYRGVNATRRSSPAPEQPAPVPAAAAVDGNREAPPGSLTKLAARAENTRRELDHARQAHTAALDALRAAIEEHAA